MTEIEKLRKSLDYWCDEHDYYEKMYNESIIQNDKAGWNYYQTQMDRVMVVIERIDLRLKQFNDSSKEKDSIDTQVNKEGARGI